MVQYGSHVINTYTFALNSYESPTNVGPNTNHKRKNTMETTEAHYHYYFWRERERKGCDVCRYYKIFESSLPMVAIEHRTAPLYRCRCDM